MDEEPKPQAPRLARPYTLVGGRTRSTGAQLALETLVWPHPDAGAGAPITDPVRLRVLQRCRVGGQSIAELAAFLDAPVGVTRVLVGDLIADGLLEAGQTPAAGEAGGTIVDLDLLKRVLSNVERL